MGVAIRDFPGLVPLACELASQCDQGGGGGEVIDVSDWNASSCLSLLSSVTSALSEEEAVVEAVLEHLSGVAFCADPERCGVCMSI